MEELKFVCDNCEGKSYEISGGHYFCTECNQQSQHHFEQEFDTPANGPKGKKIPTATSHTTGSTKSTATTVKQKLTTWEAYNNILFALTGNLIGLGADISLKKVVKCLWLKYLDKIDAINKNVTNPPKLSASSRLNAEIIYGRRTMKRKRRTSSASSQTSNTSNGSSKRELARLKRAVAERMAEKQQEQQEQEAASQNPLNVSLGSVQSSLDTSTQEKQKYLRYTPTAKKELLKHMSHRHFKKHVKDVNSTLECHKISTRKLSSKYYQHAENLTPSKVYGILYLGLLMIKDKIQLGDMVRFLREGHIYHHDIHELLPENIQNTGDFINKSNKHPHHSYLREVSSTLLKYLDLSYYFQIQDLVELVKRFCKELELPDELEECVRNLIARTKPQMKIHDKIPNYEARAISFIIFVLKLLFGLDGVAEIKLSETANSSNDNSFNLVKWLEHIVYRQLVIAQFYFPVAFDRDQEVDSKLFLKFSALKHLDDSDDENDDPLYKKLELILNKLDEYDSSEAIIEFKPSMTPYHDYTAQLCNDAQIGDYNIEVLKRSFNACSLTYLFNSGVYPANDDILFVLMPEQNTYTNYQRIKRVDCFITNDAVGNDDVVVNLNSHGGTSKKPTKCLPKHQFWLNVFKRDAFDNVTFNKYFNELPSSFRLIVNECARVTSQTVKDILYEYSIVELFMCYCFSFENNVIAKSKLIDEKLSSVLDNVIESW